MKTLLFKPFERYSEQKLLIAGLLFTFLGTYTAFAFGFRLDGVFDAHLSKDISLLKVMLDAAINIFSLFFFLFIAAKIVNGKTRAIDILNGIMVSRLPLYLLTFFNINQWIGKSTDRIGQYTPNELIQHINPSDIWAIAIFGLVTIIFIVWLIALLYNAYKVACNAKGLKATVLFIAALILAEILSKVLIHNFN